MQPCERAWGVTPAPRDRGAHGNGNGNGMRQTKTRPWHTALRFYDRRMLTLSQSLSFLLVAVLITASPGPDNLMVLGMGMSKGRKQGIAFGLGCALGCLSHTVLAAIGVSAVVAASPLAFTLLKWAGAAYLVYIGLRMLGSRAPSAMNLRAYCAGAMPSGGLKAIFFRGFWTNALNPKVALFFLAFLPQFIAPSVEHKPLAFLLLGLLFNFNAVWVNLGWACAAVWLARKAGGLQARMHWLDRVAGTLFIVFGLKLAFTDHPNP